MAGINKVILVGNLGKDPELMTFDNNVKKASFSIATTESFKDREGNWQDRTEWHNIVLWGYLAEKKLFKGDQVYVEGKLRTRSWEDNSGNKRYTTEIFGDKILKLGREKTDGSQSQPKVDQEIGQAAESAEIETPDDDLPF
jgi:single-strand DNA-binding protein